MREQQGSRARVVQKAVESIEAKLETDEVKGGRGDLVRLLQIEKDLDAVEPREVTVKWVDPPKASPAAER
jgi:hypothetical protein